MAGQKHKTYIYFSHRCNTNYSSHQTNDLDEIDKKENTEPINTKVERIINSFSTKKASLPIGYSSCDIFSQSAIKWRFLIMRPYDCEKN